LSFSVRKEVLQEGSKSCKGAFSERSKKKEVQREREYTNSGPYGVGINERGEEFKGAKRLKLWGQGNSMNGEEKKGGKADDIVKVSTGVRGLDMV